MELYLIRHGQSTNNLLATAEGRSHDPPLTETGQRQAELDLSNNSALLQANSPNHNNQGQNVLFNAGQVDFLPDRLLGPTRDDIFTIQSALRYHGNEAPQSSDDTFIAP